MNKFITTDKKSSCFWIDVCHSEYLRLKSDKTIHYNLLFFIHITKTLEIVIPVSGDTKHFHLAELVRCSEVKWWKTNFSETSNIIGSLAVSTSKLRIQIIETECHKKDQISTDKNQISKAVMVWFIIIHIFTEWNSIVL